MSRYLVLVVALLGSILPEPAQPTGRDMSTATSFSADCICDQGGGYLNAYSYRVPWRPESYKVGSVITIHASGCQYLSACKERALTGKYQMKIDSWNSNTAHVYKFAINGPIQ